MKIKIEEISLDSDYSGCSWVKERVSLFNERLRDVITDILFSFVKQTNVSTIYISIPIEEANRVYITDSNEIFESIYDIPCVTSFCIGKENKETITITIEYED